MGRGGGGGVLVQGLFSADLVLCCKTGCFAPHCHYSSPCKLILTNGETLNKVVFPTDQYPIQEVNMMIIVASCYDSWK